MANHQKKIFEFAGCHLKKKPSFWQWWEKNKHQKSPIVEGLWPESSKQRDFYTHFLFLVSNSLNNDYDDNNMDQFGFIYSDNSGGQGY